MLEAYDGSSNPTEHLATFHAHMTLYGTSDKEEEHLGQYLTRFIDERSNQYIAAETLAVEKREDHKRPRAEPSRGPPSGLPRRRMEREKGLLKTLNPRRSRAEDRDHRRSCLFHRDYEHDTEEFYDLNNQIEDLIHHGHLDRYIMKPREPFLCPKGPMERHTDVIVGGPAAGGKRPRPRPRSDPGFTFQSKSEYPYHDYALVVTAHIANARVRRIMIDTGSSIDILYLDAFHKLGMTNRDLIPMTSTLTGFTGDAITPVGVVTLPVTFGNEPRTKTLMVHFMVVDLPSVYNVIIGWLTLNVIIRQLRAIVSTYHRNMKFPTSAGSGETKSDPQESR
ncbi:hypothetical protein BHE74_00045140 [Ensete ventricosum]|nr:hypothetical protein GW17_00030818 [Ensete ventricosum]RWW48755.1 hypothetical protein BHE74_00045140 [Ensete ventricosum]RZR99443.1 hypothetical protein BHM03_00028993 [Ensete ventricosum]